MKKKTESLSSVIVSVNNLTVGLDVVPFVPYTHSKPEQYTTDYRDIEKEMIVIATMQSMGFSSREKYESSYPGSIKYEFSATMYCDTVNSCLEDLYKHIITHVDYATCQISIALFPSAERFKTCIDSDIQNYKFIWIFSDYKV